jgi:hypothetical protein
LIKTIRCLSIEAIGPKVMRLSLGRRTLTFTQGRLLLFVEEHKIPRTKIVNPDYFYDVLIQRLEPMPPPKPVYRPIPVDNSPAVPFM